MLRTTLMHLRRKLGDDAKNPTYIFAEPRVGYRMPKGETGETKEVSGRAILLPRVGGVPAQRRR